MMIKKHASKHAHLCAHMGTLQACTRLVAPFTGAELIFRTACSVTLQRCVAIESYSPRRSNIKHLSMCCCSLTTSGPEHVLLFTDHVWA